MLNAKLKKISLLALFSASLLSLQGCLATAAVGTAAVVTKVATDPRTTGTQIDDEVLEEKVSYAINKDAQLNEEARIVPVSYQGNVLLMGQAPDEMAGETAKNLAAGVDNVQQVYNEIRVGEIIDAAQIAKDTWITTKAKSKLLASAEVKSTDIKVTTEDGEVFLMGSVTQAQAEAATEAVRYINGVNKVVTAFTYVQ